MLAILAFCGACADPFSPPPDNPTSIESGQILALTATVTDEAAQMEFNRQYLELQERMQRENREVSAISNIMKTKHETAKNSINNVR
jgi:hypothetical protein